MKTEVITNQYDRQRSPVKRLPDTHFSLDFANSDNAVEIDSGIRETIKLAVTFAPELDAKTRKYLTDINVKAGEALQAGEVRYMTSLYDMEKLRQFERGAEKMKNEMRSKS